MQKMLTGRISNLQLLLNFVDLVSEMFVGVNKVIDSFASMEHGGMVFSSDM